MKHPIILLVALFLSIAHVTRRFILHSNEFRSEATIMPITDQFDTQIIKPTNEDEAAISFLHESIPSDLDRPVNLLDAGSSDLGSLQTRPSRHRLHAPYALWAHGHFAFLHHTQHGDRQLAHEAAQLESMSIPVDAVIIDSFWWHPARYLAPHPQLYPRGWNGGGAYNGRVVLWTSALVPTSTKEYIDGRRRGFFVHLGDDRQSATPHIFVWSRKDSPALHGALVDFTNPQAVRWFAGLFETLLRENQQVLGVRCAGVDALVEPVRNLFGSIGHIDSTLYRSLYYRFFLDVGRRVRGASFLVVGRAVDSFGHFKYQKFAPRDSLFAGWVGDHPFTFSGFRESAMNVIHSAYHCYVNVGSVVGGSYLEAPPSASVFRAALNESAVADAGLSEHIQQTRKLGRSVREAEVFPIVLAGPMAEGGRELDKPREQCTEQSLRTMRDRELFLRWAQFSSILPFLVNGGGRSHNTALWRSHAPSRSLYRRLVHEHRALALYYSTEAADSLDHFFDSEFHYQNVPFKSETSKLHVDPRAQHCSVIPLRREAIFFSEPLSEVEWSLRIGDHLILIPSLHSFGARANRTISVGDMLAYLDVNFLNNADQKDAATAEVVGEMEMLRKIHFSEWVVASEISQVILLDGSARGHTDVRLRIPAPTDIPLVLRRRDALIPLLFRLPEDALAAHSSNISFASTTAVLFTVDAPRRGTSTSLKISTRTTLAGGGGDDDRGVNPTDFIPAMEATVVVRRREFSSIEEGKPSSSMQFAVKFLSSEEDASSDGGTASVSDDDDGLEQLLWDPSLRFVSGFSEASAIENQVSPSCRCTFESRALSDSDDRPVEVGCSELPKHIEGSVVGDSVGLMHERHHLRRITISSIPGSGGLAESPPPQLWCAVSNSIVHKKTEQQQGSSVVSVQQLVVASAIDGQYQCSCDTW